MGYEDESRRVRKLTPFESELRATAPVTRPLERPPGGVRRLLTRLRRRRPPTTLAGAIARGLVTIGVILAIGLALAWLVASWVDRDVATVLYLGGAMLLLGGLAFARSGPDVDEYGRTAPPVDIRPGLPIAAAGVLLLAAGVVAELI
jgi:hypothetical protein